MLNLFVFPARADPYQAIFDEMREPGSGDVNLLYLVSVAVLWFAGFAAIFSLCEKYGNPRLGKLLLGLWLFIGPLPVAFVAAIIFSLICSGDYFRARVSVTHIASKSYNYITTIVTCCYL